MTEVSNNVLKVKAVGPAAEQGTLSLTELSRIAGGRLTMVRSSSAMTEA